LFASHDAKPIDISPFKHLYPFESNFLSINGFRYHYIDEGVGDPLVMIHGNPTWSFYFRALIREFSPCFRTIAMDHIGCGLSDKPSAERYDYTLQQRINDLKTFLDYIVEPPQKITLVLHDWGGMIGMAYALQHLDRIQRLVILNTAAFFPPAGKPIPLRLRAIRELNLFSTVSVLGLNLFARGALLMASNKKLPADIKSGLIAPYNCPQNRIATLMFVKDIPVKRTDPSYHVVENVDKNLSRLRDIPMLICWGMKDFVFDKTYLAEWRKRFPDATVHMFKDAGHYILEDAPQKVIDCMRDFMVS
jgi:pimeloyl-ACP methyl ester carboxylesterase